MVRFVAEIVHIDDTAGGLIRVGFSNGRAVDDGREYLLFDRLYEVQTGGRTVAVGATYVERNDQGGGGDGGVARVELYPDLIRVELVGETADQSGSARYEIGFSVPPGEYEQLRQALRLVLAGSGCLVEYPA